MLGLTFRETLKTCLLGVSWCIRVLVRTEWLRSFSRVPVLARCRHEAKSRRKSQLQPPKPWQVDFTNPAASAVEALRQGDNLRLAQAVLAWSKARYLTGSDEQVLSRFNLIMQSLSGCIKCRQVQKLACVPGALRWPVGLAARFHCSGLRFWQLWGGIKKYHAK